MSKQIIPVAEPNIENLTASIAASIDAAAQAKANPLEIAQLFVSKGYSGAFAALLAREISLKISVANEGRVTVLLGQIAEKSNAV